MKKILSFLPLAATLAGCCCDCAKSPVAKSPDGRNTIRLFVNPLSYEVTRDGVTVVARTPIALHLSGETLSGSGKVARVSCGDYTGREAAAVYKKAEIDLTGKWIFADYGDWGVRLVARNDGVGYRFETKKNGKVKVVGETASLVLPDPGARCWVNFTNRFGCEETVPQALAGKDITTDGKGRLAIYLPFVYTTGGKTIAVTESDVYDYPIWNLTRGVKNDKAEFAALFDRWPMKVKKGGRHIKVEERSDYLVETDGTRTYPWRTFVLTDEPVALCEADIVRALARPAATGHDFAWVKPGKVAWDWWNAFDNKGTAKGCTTATYLRFIDFAAKTGVEYVILDEGWSENLNIWKYHPNVDVPKIIEYGKKKGVGIILWLAWAQAYGQEARVASHFAKIGAKGFKVDFMDRGDADCERFLWKFAEESRKCKMLVDYHGVHRPTGLSRAYPNVVNYEGIHGLEQTKWFRRNYDFMANDVRAFFLRMTAGPMDYTPGAMDNYPVNAYKGTGINPGSMGTRCRQMAMMSMYEAPLQMLCDSPTKYERNMESFTFMAGTPVVWTATVGLGGTPDTYAAIARRSTDGAWYASAISNADARRVTVETAKFLEPGEWKAEIFRDAPDADKEPVKYVHETKKVTAGDKLTFDMAPGGGFIVKFTK
jgi:alpha-glucosidase